MTARNGGRHLRYGLARWLWGGWGRGCHVCAVNGYVCDVSVMDTSKKKRRSRQESGQRRKRMGIGLRRCYLTIPPPVLKTLVTANSLSCFLAPEDLVVRTAALGASWTTVFMAKTLSVMPV